MWLSPQRCISCLFGIIYIDFCCSYRYQQVCWISTQHVFVYVCTVKDMDISDYKNKRPTYLQFLNSYTTEYSLLTFRKVGSSSSKGFRTWKVSSETFHLVSFLSTSSLSLSGIFLYLEHSIGTF